MILFDHIKFNIYFGERKKNWLLFTLSLLMEEQQWPQQIFDSDESSSIASTYQLQVSSKPRIVAIKEAILN